MSKITLSIGFEYHIDEEDVLKLINKPIDMSLITEIRNKLVEELWKREVNTSEETVIFTYKEPKT